MPSLVFKDAEQARDSICIEDQRKIRDLYAEWADKVAERAEFYEKKTTASSYWQQQQMLELERQLRSQSMQIHKEIESGSKSSMYMISDSVVGCNAEFLKTLGFKEEGINAAFTSVPNRVVSNIVTGQIYKSGWSLSKAIWTDNQKTLSDIYSIVAQGRAMNMSAYEVSKMLERYVSPSRKMQWNLKMNDGVKIYKKTVDYNAQRLVRTLNQHAYQQSVIQVAKDNPFIQGIYWRANGSRVCPLCMDRDGNFYKWNEVPMDHPNGMCTMEPAIDMDKTIDQLADWIKEPDGTYYVSVLVEENIILSEFRPKTIVGIDLGVKDLVTASNYEKYNNKKVIEKYEKRIKRKQKRLAKKQKGSNNYLKLKREIARIYKKIKNARKYNTHHITKDITDNNDIIVCETLMVKNMVKNHNLAKAINDASLSEIIRQLRYKSKWKGKKFYQIDPFFASSQICSHCGYKNETLKNLSIRNYSCPNCHYELDRDVNAAINICFEGLNMYMNEVFV